MLIVCQSIRTWLETTEYKLWTYCRAVTFSKSCRSSTRRAIYQHNYHWKISGSRYSITFTFIPLFTTNRQIFDLYSDCFNQLFIYFLFCLIFNVYSIFYSLLFRLNQRQFQWKNWFKVKFNFKKCDSNRT